MLFSEIQNVGKLVPTLEVCKPKLINCGTEGSNHYHNHLAPATRSHLVPVSLAPPLQTITASSTLHNNFEAQYPHWIGLFHLESKP